MKIGLVGVGTWGHVLAAKFREAGAKIVAHDRLAPREVDPSNFFGERLPWQIMLSPVGSSHVDALVVAAPPDVTLEVTLAAVKAGVPIFATKPLQLEQPLKLMAALFVDYVKLWSPRWHKFKQAQTLITDVEIEFYGPGPVRSFPGLLDYGAHALAYAHDLLMTSKLDIRTATVATKRTDGSHIVIAYAYDNKVPVTITTGNGAASKRQRVTINGSTVYEDDPREDPLAIMIREFIQHVQTGRVDLRLMHLTNAVTASLNTIRSACALNL